MLVFVSTSEDGRIDGYRLDADTGLLTRTGSTDVGKLVMPMTVVPQRHPRLYAAVRSVPSSINAFDIDRAAGTLRDAGPATALTDNKVYLSADNTGRYLFTASFAGNNFAVFRLLENGLPEPLPCQVISIGGKAHCIIPDRSNRFVYAINFGEGCILSFHFDAETGALTPTVQGVLRVDPRQGPRVAVVSPDNRYLYVIHQHTGEIAQFEIDQSTGTLRHVGDTLFVQADMGLVPGVARENAAEANSTGAVEGDVPRIWASDIKITPDGRFLYATERTRSAIVLLQLDAQSGRPAYVARFAAERQPRGIAIDPSGRWLVAAGEKSDKLSVFGIDRESGHLQLHERYPVGRGANWVEVVDLA